MRFANFIMRLLVGGAFVFAGSLKILDPPGFAEMVAHFQMLPHELVNLVALTLPWVELVAGLSLVLGFWRRASALVITVLCFIFLIAVTQVLIRGIDTQCGCFGHLFAGRMGPKHLLLDGALFAMAGWLAWKQKE